MRARAGLGLSAFCLIEESLKSIFFEKSRKKIWDI